VNEVEGLPEGGGVIEFVGVGVSETVDVGVFEIVSVGVIELFDVGVELTEMVADAGSDIEALGLGL
jgi:hypothetical protein